MTLTQTAILTKRFFVGSLVFLVVLGVGILGYRYYYYNYYLPNLKPVEILPDVKFGILPQPNLIKNDFSTASYSYSLDTETGSLPKDIPKIINVYFIPQLEVTFLAPDKAKTLAASFGFLNGPEILNPTQFKFTDDNGGEFIMDINTSNFRFKKNVATGSATLEIIEDQPKLISDFKSYLALKQVLKPPLINGRSEVIYQNSIQKDSQTATISLWQDKINNFEIVTDKLSQGLVRAIATKNRELKDKYTGIEYTFWQVDESTFGTYPIKTPDEAFAQLKSGLGSIILQPKTNRASITNVYLAYLLTENYTPYLQPVYVFQGDNFAALIPAVTKDYLAK